jgi:carbonic anhydrase
MQDEVAVDAPDMVGFGVGGQCVAEVTGTDEAALEASAVADPHITVAADVERLLASPLLPPQMSVSGHVYDAETGRVTTVLDARHPQPAGNS